MVEPWEVRKPDLSALTPDTSYHSFARPGYSFAYLSAALPGRRGAAARRAALSGSQEATLLGAGLWAATPALTQNATLAAEASQRVGVGTLGRAAASKASQELTTLLPERQRRKLAAATAKRARGTTSQVMSIAITGSSDGLTLGEGVPLPPGEEGAALRLQAVLAGRRLQETAEGQGAGTWQTELWLP